MTLVGLTYLIPVRPRGLPHFDNLDLRSTNHALIGWRILIKGPRIVFIKPASKDSEMVIRVIPRQHFAEWWEGDEADLNKIDSWPPSDKEKK